MYPSFFFSLFYMSSVIILWSQPNLIKPIYTYMIWHWMIYITHVYRPYIYLYTRYSYMVYRKSFLSSLHFQLPGFLLFSSQIGFIFFVFCAFFLLRFICFCIWKSYAAYCGIAVYIHTYSIIHIMTHSSHTHTHIWERLSSWMPLVVSSATICITCIYMCMAWRVWLNTIVPRRGAQRTMMKKNHTKCHFIALNSGRQLMRWRHHDSMPNDAHTHILYI